MSEATNWGWLPFPLSSFLARQGLTNAHGYEIEKDFSALPLYSSRDRYLSACIEAKFAFAGSLPTCRLWFESRLYLTVAIRRRPCAGRSDLRTKMSLRHSPRDKLTKVRVA